MVIVIEETTIKCPHCRSEKISKYGKNTGKQRYICKNPECSHKTFYTEYKYNSWKPEVRKRVLAWSADGAGIRAIARQEKISKNTVSAILKKRKNGLKTLTKNILMNTKILRSI
jgi:transposase-like protein